MYEFFLSEDQKLNKIANPVDGCWINVLDPTDDEIKALSSLLPVDRDFITAALDEEERPRIESEDNSTLIVVDIPLVEINPETKSFIFSTIPLGIIISPMYLVTICLKKSQLIKDFIDNRVKTFRTYKKNRFLLQLMYRNAGFYLQYLRQIDKISNNIENDLQKSTKNRELLMLRSLEKSLVYFSTSLKSNEVVLEKLLRYNYSNIDIKKYSEDEDLLEDVIIENKQAIEMANIYSNILSGTMEAFASIISNNLNIVMKLLAAITIVMAVPSMVSGFFGMNVRGIPFADISGAFYMILAGTLVLCGVIILILVKKRML